MTSTRALNAAGQSLWLDNITRPMLDDATLAGLHRRAQRHRADLEPDDLRQGDRRLRRLRRPDRRGRPRRRRARDEEVFFDLAIDDLRRAADEFAEVHERTAHLDGFVSLEVSPELAFDTGATIAQARELHARMERPNVFIKIPGHAGGPARDRRGDPRGHSGERDAAVLQRASPRRRRRLDDRHRAPASPTGFRPTCRPSRRCS